MSTVQGLPGPLPEGERLLWQGGPDRRLFARRVMHLRKLACYFAVLVAAVAANAVHRGDAPAQAAIATLTALAAACVPLALIQAYAWAVARATAYTITDRRVALRIGLVVPLTINLPFARIADVGMAARAGDIALSLSGTDKIAYFVLWPHARPWRVSKPEPMLRSLRNVEEVAQILARALAASAGMAPPVVGAVGPGVGPVAGAMPDARRAPRAVTA